MRYDDIWSDDDPAVKRLREALAYRPPAVAPKPPTETAEPVIHEPTRKERLLELLRRLRAGDPSAVEALRELMRNKE